MLVMTNYAKSYANNYASTIYQSLAMRRSATRSELCLRLTFSDIPWPGRTSKEDMWIVSDCSLSRFVWIFVAETQVCRRGDADRSPISVPDYIYRVIYASFTRFQIFFKRESFFSISLSLSFFFFFLKKQNKTKGFKNREHVGYLNRFRRLQKNEKTTEIQCMITSL